MPQGAFRRRRLFILLLMGAALIAAGVVLVLMLLRGNKVEPPPRATDRIAAPRQLSTIEVPIDIEMAVLSRALEDAVPHTLWSIDRRLAKCVPAQRIKLFKARLKVTPDMGCTVIGTVTRSAIRLRGLGEEIVADVPIHAAISARNVGGVLKGETATGSAMVQARIRLAVNESWHPRATVRLTYSWTSEPGIDFLGQRISFAEKADEKLAPVVREVERKLAAEIARLDVRSRVAAVWRTSFTSLELNEQNPPVWMRITPQQLNYGGYRISGSRLRLNLGLAALTETFVGPRPADPTPTPLPPLGRDAGGTKLSFFVPVIADYAELEPVLQKALSKRQRRPFDIPGIGPVIARFERVIGYGTTNGRIAVGLQIAARRVTDSTDTRGMVWLTALPVNTPGSQRVRFEQLQVEGDTDRLTGDLLVRLVQAPAVSELLADELTQNFTKDYQKLLGKIRRAIVDKRAGDFRIQASIAQVRTGTLKASGQGLYLPVWAEGAARVEYRPGR